MQGFLAGTYRNKSEMIAALTRRQEQGVITPYEEEVLHSLKTKNYKKSAIAFDKFFREEFKKNHAKKEANIALTSLELPKKGTAKRKK